MVIVDNKELGFVGTPHKIRTDILKQIIEKNEIPIVAPLGLNSDNQVYNINADTTAGAIAKELRARRLLIVSDVEGVLDKKQNLISEINSLKANEMISNDIITGGMIPKLTTCLDTVKKGVDAAVILDGRVAHSILLELFTDQGIGTLISQK